MLNIVNKSKNTDLEPYFNDINLYYKKTLKTLKLKDNYDLSLIICGPRTIKKINKQYRSVDAVTDVISFASLDDDNNFFFEENIELGDIFINYERVFSQAKEYSHSIKREFIFLFVHGLLHLFGYDHMNLKDEKKMFGLQKKIVGNLS